VQILGIPTTAIHFLATAYRERTYSTKYFEILIRAIFESFLADGTLSKVFPHSCSGKRRKMFGARAIKRRRDKEAELKVKHFPNNRDSNPSWKRDPFLLSWTEKDDNGILHREYALT